LLAVGDCVFNIFAVTLHVGGRSSILNLRLRHAMVTVVKQFKYLGTALTNQNSIQEEIKSILKSGNAYYISFRQVSSFTALVQCLNDSNYRDI